MQDDGIIFWVRKKLDLEALQQFLAPNQKLEDLTVSEMRETKETDISGLEIIQKILDSKFLQDLYTINPFKKNNTCLNFCKFSAKEIANLSDLDNDPTFQKIME